MSAESHELPWVLVDTEYEGLPLRLRVCPDAAANSDHRNSFQQLGIVTLDFAQVQSNGMPEGQYNLSLKDFDLSLQAAIRGDGDGVVVVVETFSGRRNFYAYVRSEDEFRSRVADLSQLSPEHHLTVDCRADSAWTFYDRYREQFRW